MKLIVVDDYPLEGKTIDFLLHKYRPNIQYCGQAQSGQEGLELALKIRPELAVIDVKMPEMDGLTLTKLMLAQLPQTKIIILSAFNDFSYVQTALRHGASDYILKPIKPEEFVQTVKRIEELLAEPVDGLLRNDMNIDIPQEFIYAIKSGNTADSIRFVREYWGKYLEPQNLSLDSYRSHVHQFLTILDYRIKQESDVLGSVIGSDSYLPELVRVQLSKAATNTEAGDILLQTVSKMADANNKHFHESGHAQVVRAKELIEANLHKEITLESIAQQLYISSHYLSRIFKKCTDVNFMTYIIYRRLEKSKYLLLTTNDTIEQIASQVGYEESNSFRRLFKKQVGLSPREFRLHKLAHK